MGHNTGWLALGAGIAGGADVVLIPEIPYDIQKVANSVLERRQSGKHFSIVAVSEGAMSTDLFKATQRAKSDLEKAKTKKDKAAKKAAKARLAELEVEASESTHRLTRRLEELTRLESRVTILGHVQRGGTPSPVDRLLASRLGSAAAHYVHEGTYGVLVAASGDSVRPIPIEEVVGKRKNVPLDHPWIQTARDLGTSLGD
jgi:6-phosphofructokinase